LERLLRSKTTAAQVNNPRRGGDSTYFLWICYHWKNHLPGTLDTH
jgi:hypothetical protein